MSGYCDEALKKLREGAEEVKGTKERAMAGETRATLETFCRQDEEFAQAIVQGGSFADCMKAVAKGVGNSISDLEAYRKAVQFYFPGAEIRMVMTIDLIGAAAGPAEEPEVGKSAAPEKSTGLMLDFTQFL